MIRFILVLVVLGALVWFAASRVPLGMVLTRLPLNDMGVEWTQSEGTVWDGRMSGVYINGQPVGDVDVALRPVSLLSLSPTMEVQWGGAGGRGAGVVTVKGSGDISASDVRVEQNISALESLTNEIRSIGGILRINGGSVEIVDNVCVSASGNVQTDALTRAAQQFGRQFSTLTGTITCEEGAFNIAMNGDSPDGDVLDFKAIADLNGNSRIDVTAETESDDIETLLARGGFTKSGDVWTYQQTTQAGGGVTP
ncbi:type II secretion system protein N [Henriciella sp. AS95]|uniref:type II secretion system protein N n=1 Tax=Henriciella sp. AS95 TaxID=3135782 RepID=UPI003178E30A